MTEVWERQEGETAKAFQAFCCYRDLGPKRTLPAAYAAYKGRGIGGKAAKRAPGFFERWGSQHNWVERAEAFDKHMHDEALAAVKTKREQHLIKLWDGAMEAFEQQMERLKEASIDELTRWYNSIRSSIQAFDVTIGEDDIPGSISAGAEPPKYDDPWLETGDDP